MGEGRERGAQAHYSPNLRPEKYPHHFPITTTPHSEVRIVRTTPPLDPTAKARPPDTFLFWEAESNGPHSLSSITMFPALGAGRCPASLFFLFGEWLQVYKLLLEQPKPWLARLHPG